MVLNADPTAYIAYERICVNTWERNVLMNHEQIQSGLSRQQLEMELQRVERSRHRFGKLRNTIIWMLIFAAVLASVSAIWFPIVWVENEFGQLFLTWRTHAVEPDDTVICELGENPASYQVVSVTGNEMEVMLLDDQFAGAVQRIAKEDVAGKVVLQIWPLPLELVFP